MREPSQLLQEVLKVLNQAGKSCIGLLTSTDWGRQFAAPHRQVLAGLL